MSSCTEPPVQANVAWFEVDEAPASARLRVYHAGDLSTWALPRGVQVDDVVLEFDAHGRTLVAGSARESIHVDLDRDLATVLPVPAMAERTTGDYGPTLWFPRNGDAIGVVPHLAGRAERFRLFPLGEAGIGRSVTLDPVPHSGEPSSLQWARSAADAPVVILTESALPRGNVQAFRYSESEVQFLGQGTNLAGRMPATGIEHQWCMAGGCIDPAGRGLLYLAEAPCTLGRWQWQTTQAGGVSASVDIAVPLACESDVVPLAAFDLDRVALETDDGFHVVGLDDGNVISVPRIGFGHTLHVVDRGRVAMLVSPGGPVIRLSADGARVLSARALLCPDPQPSVVSPRGTWAAWSCVDSNPSLQTPGAHGATIVRVSALGMDVFPSLPMKVLAIDDLGNALMYSGDIEFGSPRALYVLTSEDRVAKVDPLNPSPAPVRIFADDLFFAASPLR